MLEPLAAQAHLTELMGLKGSLGQRRIVMGCIRSTPDGSYMLEDAGSSVPLDLESAELAAGFVTGVWSQQQPLSRAPKATGGDACGDRAMCGRAWVLVCDHRDAVELPRVLPPGVSAHTRQPRLCLPPPSPFLGFAENCVVMAEGELGHDGRFAVSALGFPTCEPREALPATAQVGRGAVAAGCCGNRGSGTVMQDWTGGAQGPAQAGGRDDGHAPDFCERAHVLAGSMYVQHVFRTVTPAIAETQLFWRQRSQRRGC